MSRIAVGLEYDGSGFCGWQDQKLDVLPSIQSTLQGALARIADAPVQVSGAGRTDAGVHARCQVAHFDTPTLRTVRGWVLGTNGHLPSTMALRWAQEVPDHFHARYSAESRSYRYCILNRSARAGLAAGRVAAVHHALDAERMHEAGQALVGEHDFSAFRSAECQAKSPVRRLTALRVARRGEFVVIEVTANAFLHHMVRNIAGLLIAVGQAPRAGQGALEDAGPWVRALLAGRDRTRAPATAPAAGLYLWRVRYPPGFGLPDDSAMMPSPAGCPADLLDE